MRKNVGVVAVVSALMCTGSAAAEARSLDDIFHVHGYGTLDAVHASLDDADFVAYSAQSQGAGYTRSWSPDVDTKLALQLDATFTEHFSGVVQLISENAQNISWNGKPNPRYRPSLEWANLQYEFSKSWSVRAGRMVLPLYMISDYRNVGYTNSFIRAPLEVYAVLPFTNLDGGEVTYKHGFGAVTNTVTGGAGALTSRSRAFAIQSRLYFLTDTVEIGSLTVRGAFLHTVFKSPTGFGGFFDDFASAADFVPGGAAAAQAARDLDGRYNYNHWSNAEFYDLGATYDPGAWYVMGELSRYTHKGIFGTANAGFISGGWRIQHFTPFATVSKIRSSYPPAEQIPLAGLPDALAGYGAAINGTVQAIAAGNTSQQTVSAGVRWDFIKNVDFKVQYDRVMLPEGSIGQLINIQPGFRPGSDFNVFSVGFDFVF